MHEAPEIHRRPAAADLPRLLARLAVPMTFEKWKRDLGGTLTHRVRKVRLAKGEQGIPEGFELEAICGESSETEWYVDIIVDDPVTCGVCREVRR